MYYHIRRAIVAITMALLVMSVSEMTVFAQIKTTNKAAVESSQNSDESSLKKSGPTIDYKKYKKTRYTRKKLTVKSKPGKKGSKVVKVKFNKKVKTGKSKNGWTAVLVNKKTEGYVKTRDLSKKKTRVWKGVKLNKRNGVVRGPSGQRETYYNLRMNRVVRNMKTFGYSTKDYKVRKDGVKTLDGYVMIATDWSKYPRGTFVNTTLGLGLVCDQCPTGGIDIAVNW